jgi:hypothetical protein
MTLKFTPSDFRVSREELNQLGYLLPIGVKEKRYQLTKLDLSTLRSMQGPKRQASVVFPIRFRWDQYESIKKLAATYAGGSIAAWIRYATLGFRPQDVELV